MTRSSFKVPGYRYLWLTAWLWHVARWMVVFATTYRVNEQTGDPLLVQLVGTAFMAPMFLGGAIAGTITDRLDRHRTVARSLGILAPLSAMMGLAVLGDQAPIGVSYLFVFCIGAGNVIDLTSRRSIAFGLVGTGLITNAAALETLALHGGNMIGTISGGAIIAALGVASVYLGVGFVYLVAMTSFIIASRVARAANRDPGANQRPGSGSVGSVSTTPVSGDPPAETPTPADVAASGQPPSTVAVSTPAPSMGQDLRAGIGLLRSNTVLRQFLMTTVLMNFFYHAFMPLIPVFAKGLGVGPFPTGLLASAAGMGTMIGASIIAKLQPARRGLIHIGGSLGAMTMLIVFANMTWYPAAFGALFLAGLSSSGFGATQSALVVSLVDESLRGRALGALSMAIGAMPFGMFSLGLIAQRTNPRLALTVSVSTGFAFLVIWQATRPHLRTLP
ncbi:MAG: MFS transporter [Actinomycetia bacterium]|nr:MFS transporter [Actinomycetes bacterium]